MHHKEKVIDCINQYPSAVLTDVQGSCLCYSVLILVRGHFALLSGLDSSQSRDKLPKQAEVF
jgi:hypothetical protein